MPTITDITFQPQKQRYWVYVDRRFCCSIRERTFPAMNLRIGQQISCEQIQELEKFHWKKAYGPDSWEKEKVRLGRVKGLIESIDGALEARVVGFGADTTEFIADHPAEHGRPDIDVVLHIGPQQRTLLSVEVTGTETMRADTTTYWVRPDKLEYARNHLEEDVWIILHYAQPQERFVFIKPDPRRQYRVSEVPIRGSIEHYVEFAEGDVELKTKEYFINYVKNQIHR